MNEIERLKNEGFASLNAEIKRLRHDGAYLHGYYGKPTPETDAIAAQLAVALEAEAQARRGQHGAELAEPETDVEVTILE